MKAKLQVQVKGNYSGFTSVMMKTYRTGGVRAFYAGFPTAFFGSAPASCIYWTSYEASKKTLLGSKYMKKNPSLCHFCSGVVAEMVSCILWVPIDVVKERLQVQNDLKSTYNGNWDAILTIYKNEGLAGIYKGYWATIFSFGPFTGLFLMFNEKIKEKTKAHYGITSDSEIPFFAFMGMGATAGSLAAFLTNPLDKAKLRLQVQRAMEASSSKEEPLFYYRGFLHGLSSIYTTEGVAGLFRGAGTRVLFQAPSTAISIACFEW
eukprot:CAMPEP_0184489532 /NCGR_PEP_ID=MMETSP0113_2-20130426/15740_1 /TAXON_ID=91329 /ORGANISM="Norrisiella sphaerica, Strain BC52" /LENGTH=262 /DNA_ID=CAMNT_0026873017 /DNA_START=87 /DNA_END=872 /DNA_ORIENTATION=-